MAGIYRSKLFRLWLVGMLLTVLQVPPAQAQEECDSTRIHTCCSTDSQCPMRYYEVSQCDASSTSVSTSAAPNDNDYDDSLNSTDSSNDTSTDVTTEMTVNTNESDGTSTSSSSAPTVYCMRCNDNCYNCSATICFTCMKSFSLKNGECVSANASDPFPVAAVVGGVVGGVVLIVVVVVVIVCMCRRKPTEPAESALDRNSGLSSTQDSSSDAESGTSERANKNPDYENMGMKMKDMPTQILHGQDNVLRYTRDPTVQKKVDEPVSRDSTYANQATIKLTQMKQEEDREIQQLPAAPGVPTAAKGSNKLQQKKKKKSRKAKVEEVAQEEPAPEAAPEDIYVNTAAVAGERLEQEEEEQVYENEPSSPYVNFGFQN